MTTRAERRQREREAATVAEHPRWLLNLVLYPMMQSMLGGSNGDECPACARTGVLTRPLTHEDECPVRTLMSETPADVRHAAEVLCGDAEKPDIVFTPTDPEERIADESREAAEALEHFGASMRALNLAEAGYIKSEGAVSVARAQQFRLRTLTVVDVAVDEVARKVHALTARIRRSALISGAPAVAKGDES